ncbi:GAF domain-containing protein [Egbenema bharatensis]|uniref:GAF domain-containing protein n=1 Tax=Egbenema bharatensis TaxID=3463334 RepID=UPI003A84B854
MTSENNRDRVQHCSLDPAYSLRWAALSTLFLPLTAEASSAQPFHPPALDTHQPSVQSAQTSPQTIADHFIQPVLEVEPIAQPFFTSASTGFSPVNQPVTLATAGTNESDNHFQFLSVLALLSLGSAAVAMSWMRSRRMAEPLRELSIIAEKVASGTLDMVTLPETNTTDINTIVQSINTLSRQNKRLQNEQDIITQYTQLIAEVTSARIVDEQDVKIVFKKALEQVRHILGVDRVVVYRFKPDWSGYIANEAVAAGLPRTLNEAIQDPCIPEDLLEAYRHNRVWFTSDVMNAGLHPKHRELMERLKIKANLVVPILNEGQLFGLLIAHDCTQTHSWETTEINILKQLAIQLGAILDRLSLLQSREKETRQSQVLKDITLEMAQADTLESVFAKLPVTKIRLALGADRVIIYQFDAEWKGTIVAESVAAAYPKALGATIYDPCFAENYVDKYRAGRVQATSNIYAAGLTECHLRQLEPFNVQANLVAPIKQGSRLLGLLIAHQCSGVREWEAQEISFFSQAAAQVGLALERADLMEQRKLAVQQAKLLAEEQRAQRESLQNQLIALLDDVEGAARGDLTVRAEVTSTDLGTVADFFNSIVESLQQIVVNVKASVFKVSNSISDNRESIRQLSDTALMQAEEIHLTLDSIQQVITSIDSVAKSAQTASEVAEQASKTSEVGKTAVDRAVQNILSQRDVIGETAKKVKRLGESSQEISKAVSLIEQIALQTNLLSINAGIEAARAGEEGQGFASVAEEIGKLAAQSAAATREIEDMIRSIQLETSEVVAAMERSTHKVVEGTHLVEDAKRSLNQISAVSHHIDELLRSITEATISQTQTSQTVTNRIQGIAQVTEQNANASRKVAASLQHAIDVARELEVSVGMFHVD